jgi:hypothetical protein
MLSFSRVSAVRGMATNGERLDESELLEVKLVRWMKFVRPNNRTFAQSAIHHDAKDLEVFAAVSQAFGASVAFPAVEVGFHRATVTGTDVGYALSDLEHFHS